MLYSELYSDTIGLIVKNAEAGRLCSEAQLQKLGSALTSWRDSDLSKTTPRAKLVWRFLRSTSSAEVFKEANITYKAFVKQFGWLKRDLSERSYWRFEEEYGVSVLAKFSRYLSGMDSLSSAGSPLGWSKQAVHQLMDRVFGQKFTSFVSKVRSNSSGLLKKSVKDKRLQLQLLKAGATLGDTGGVASLYEYGKGRIRFTQRPEALLFKSLTGTFKLLKAREFLKGVL